MEISSSRRAFIGGLAATGVLTLSSADDRKSSAAYDVIVAGGGPAGIAAAVAAARSGKRTMLVESHGCLGGIWTAGLVGLCLDFDKDGLTREIANRLDELGARKLKEYDTFSYEPEYMKFVCEELCREAGVRIRLGTMVVAAVREGRNVTAVVTESKSGRETWRAKAFVDATGDGDLAARAGCGFDMGIGEDNTGQPASLLAAVLVENAAELAPYNMLQEIKEGEPTPREKLRLEMKRAGVEPSYGWPTMFFIHPHLAILMSNHEYKVRVDDADAITEATLRARREVIGHVAALAKLGGPWRNLRVAATAEQIGHRTSRRIHGCYTITREDVIAGTRFPDSVCECRYPADIHALDAKTGRTIPADVEGATTGVKWRPFQVPLRALQAKDVENLWMAGRCISGDYIAHASYRVTGVAVATGEAAGRAAAAIC